jgi:hypothetical protein
MTITANQLKLKVVSGKIVYTAWAVEVGDTEPKWSLEGVFPSLSTRAAICLSYAGCYCISRF